MGHASAKVDDKGRLKIPAEFRKIIEQKFGPECFITSEDGQKALIYPMPVWYDYQARLAKVPSASVARTKLIGTHRSRAIRRSSRNSSLRSSFTRPIG